MVVRTILLAGALLSGLADEKTEAEAIKKAVFDSQRAGFEKHDLAAYMALWTDDIRIISGRGEEPGKYDTALDRKQVEANSRLRFQGKPQVQLTYDSVQVSVKGNEADLRVQTTVKFKEGEDVVGERFRLRKTAAGWQAYENRWWPIRSEIVGDKQVFTVEKWKSLDAEVEKVKGDPRPLAFALSDAFRFREAYDVSKQVTAAKDAEAEDWVFRGNVAMFVGDAADAVAAYAKALALDPKAAVPEFFRAKK